MSSHKADHHKSDKKKRHKSDREFRDEQEEEERRQRKEMKKAAKVAKELGYTNDINPFGDSNLLQPFVWGKKKERDLLEGRKEEKTEAKRVEVMGEIEKVRKRRREREEELAEIERLRDEEQRLREAVQYGDWQKKEEDFHLEQTKERSKIRLIESRAKPIDLVAKNVLLIESAESTSSGTERKQRDVSLLGVEFEHRSPTDLIASFGEDELHGLKQELQAYLELEVRNKGSYIKYWEALLLLVDSAQQAFAMKRRQQASIHETVVAEVSALLANKSIEELDALENDIKKNIAEGRGGDVDYWETMLKEIQTQRARTFAKTVHISLMTRQVELLSDLQVEQRQLREQARLAAAEADSLSADQDWQLQRRFSSAGAGDMSSAEERTQLSTVPPPDDIGLEESAMANNDEIMLPGSTYWWDGKYRPRKPRFLNKIRTGWDWNKYNSTHYDRDNPPPKVVQGYRFTLFYSDLIDKEKTPKYFVEPCEGTTDFVILRFHAGPPYEDIAFKIVNKEWDTHRRSGFRSSFDRGVLQLTFNFMRSFYRR